MAENDITGRVAQLLLGRMPGRLAMMPGLRNSFIDFSPAIDDMPNLAEGYRTPGIDLKAEFSEGEPETRQPHQPAAGNGMLSPQGAPCYCLAGFTYLWTNRQVLPRWGELRQ